MSKKKIVLIIGGTSGIGLGLIEYLLDTKEYKILSFSKNKDKIELLQKKYKDVEFLICDISDPDKIKEKYKYLLKKYKKLDAIVNCAGILKMGKIETQSIEDWNEVIKVNLSGAFYISKIMLPLLKKGDNPSIIHISSLNAHTPGGSISYCASKAGVEILVKCLAQELAQYNIRVNAVCPGATNTNIYIASGLYSKEEYQKWNEEKAKDYPLGKIAHAKKDIAPIIEFLLSDKSLWTTGSVFVVDGGKSIAR